MLADASRCRRVCFHPSRPSPFGGGHAPGARRASLPTIAGRVARGRGRLVSEAAALLKASRSWVTKMLARYRRRRCPDDLAEGSRSGRPPLAPALSSTLLTVALQADPLAFGYAASGWTVPLLAAHLRDFCGDQAGVSVRTLRRRLHAAGLAWKRPRYVFGTKEPHRAQKKGRSCVV